MSDRHIEVWLDETSDSDDPTYCVSLCEEDGEEVKLIGTRDAREEADELGLRAADKRGIPVMFRETSGATSSL